MNTNKQAGAALRAIMAVAEAIRSLGSVPSGHLYAQVMQYMSLQSYERIIETLVGAGVIKVQNHLITWEAK